MSAVMDMLRTRPGAPFTDDRALAECIDLCFECAEVCTTCADACLGEESVDALRRCVRRDLDCADVCEATGRLLSRPHEPDLEVLKSALDLAARACRSCGDECDRHADRHEHCRLCRDVCRRCEDACRRLGDAIARIPREATTRH
jgi:hypothetical protein